MTPFIEGAPAAGPYRTPGRSRRVSAARRSTAAKVRPSKGRATACACAWGGASTIGEPRLADYARRLNDRHLAAPIRRAVNTVRKAPQHCSVRCLCGPVVCSNGHWPLIVDQDSKPVRPKSPTGAGEGVGSVKTRAVWRDGFVCAAFAAEVPRTLARRRSGDCEHNGSNEGFSGFLGPTGR